MSTYKDLKTANPTFPILVREAENVKARLIARYGKSAYCRPACHPLVAHERSSAVLCRPRVVT